MYVNRYIMVRQVFRVPIGGMLLRQPMALGGSGSTYIFGYADAHFKKNMNKTEALQFCANGGSNNYNCSLKFHYFNS